MAERFCSFSPMWSGKDAAKAAMIASGKTLTVTNTRQTKRVNMMVSSDIRFEMLGSNNVGRLIDLKVRETEAHLISPNAEWISQAAFINEATTFGIFDNAEACGLISMIDPRQVEDAEDLAHYQTGCLYVWRVMVDQNHRRKGVGTTAINFARNYAKLLGFGGVSLTTMDRSPLSAREFYAQLGFSPTGRRLNGEVELVWRDGV